MANHLTPKPEMVVKFVIRERITNALVKVVFGEGFTPMLTVSYIRCKSGGFRSSETVDRAFVPHVSQQVPGEPYWCWPEESK